MPAYFLNCYNINMEMKIREQYKQWEDMAKATVRKQK